MVIKIEALITGRFDRFRESGKGWEKSGQAWEKFDMFLLNLKISTNQKFKIYAIMRGVSLKIFVKGLNVHLQKHIAL